MTKTTNLEELIQLCTQWGKDRGIIGNGTLKAQLGKLTEEQKETIDGFKKGSNDEMKDGIGDSLVVLIQMMGIYETTYSKCLVEATRGEVSLSPAMIYDLDDNASLEAAINNDFMIEANIGAKIINLAAIAFRLGFNLEECLAIAYDEIKDRKGHLDEHGVFHKEK